MDSGREEGLSCAPNNCVSTAKDSERDPSLYPNAGTPHKNMPKSKPLDNPTRWTTELITLVLFEK
jgi:hypothetical protein